MTRDDLRKFVVLAMLFALALAAAVACGGTEANDGSEYIGGQDLGSFLASNMSDVNDVPLRGVACPNERLIEGDSVICTATFSDGSTKDIRVSVNGFSDGAPQVRVDLP